MMKFLVLLALLSSNLAFAQVPALSSKSYLLVDFQSRQILAARNPDERVEPASLTKLMTAYVVFDALRQKRIVLAQPFSVSEKAWHAPGSRMFLTVAESVSVEELLGGMIVQSGNDAAITLAEGVAGSEEAFVDGLKTGYTESAGFCMIATALRKDRRLIAVVLNAGSENGRAVDAQKLLNYGFEAFETVKLYAGGQPIHALPVWKGNSNELQAGLPNDYFVTLPKGFSHRLKTTIESMQPLMAAIRIGDAV